jgi:type I restriction-modification system DNA methylase subunit
MIFHLSAKGRIGMVLANGSLSSRSGGEGAIRRAIIEDDLVECIIAMPGQLFYTTQIPVSLWFLNKKKDQKGHGVHGFVGVPQASMDGRKTEHTPPGSPKQDVEGCRGNPRNAPALFVEVFCLLPIDIEGSV